MRIPTLCDPYGHTYSRNYGSRDVNSGRINWLCKHYYRANLKCTARATTDGPVITSIRGTHNHQPQLSQNDVVMSKYEWSNHSTQ